MTMMNDIRKMQKWAGAPVDGVFGPVTARRVAAKIEALGVFFVEPIESPVSIVQGTGKAIRNIIIHTTATREGQDIDAATIRRWHKGQGWSDIGYHFVIRLDGEVERGRPESQVGAHARGWNTGSIGVVYVGGLDSQGRSKDTRTPAQVRAMAALCKELLAAYPGARIMGHRDTSPDRDGDGVIEKHEWLKDCPCFDVKTWWEGVS